MSFDFGGFGQAGTGIGNGGGSSTPTTLSTLADVNLGVLSGGQVLKYDGNTGLWINANDGSAFVAATGTLAARPATPLSDTIYIVSGDSTPSNNGLTSIYFVASPGWIDLDTKITSRKIDDLSDVDTTTTPPTLNQALVWNNTNWVPGNVSGAFTGTLAGRPASYTANTLYIISGDATTSNNGRAFLYNTGTSAWVELDTTIANRKLDELLDVDVSTTAPVEGSGIKWDNTLQKWVTNTSNFSQTDIAYSTNAPPAFTGIKPGTIWVDPNTFDQYIYVIDGGGNPQWITLGSSGGGGGSASMLSALTDVDVTAPPTNGQVLAYDSTATKWKPTTVSGGGSISINSLTDVDTATTPPSNNDYLTWNGTNWVPIARPTLVTNLNGLSDVDTVTTPPVNSNLLQFNGTNWVPVAYPSIPSVIDNLTDVDTTTTPPINNDILKFNGTNWVPGANTPSITSNQATATTATISSGAWATIATLNTVNGTCLFNYNIRYAGSGATVLKARIYDSTGSAVITNSEVYVTRNGLGIDEGSYSGTCIGTLVASSTIQLQVYVTGSACDIKSDTEGRTLINYMRIS